MHVWMSAVKDTASYGAQWYVSYKSYVFYIFHPMEKMSSNLCNTLLQAYAKMLKWKPAVKVQIDQAYKIA